MPHATHTRNLGRSSSWRKATVQSLAQALLKHERIETTLARAKEAQRLVERLITLGKAESLAARRQAISILNDAQLVRRLFADVAPRFSTRSGGYTRILHQGYRVGDGASLAILELVELAPDLKKPREKGKEKEKAERPKLKVREEEVRPEERPAPTPKQKEERPPQPEKKEKQPEKPKRPEATEKKELEKPKGFIDGLRRFFRKDRPKE